MSYIIALIIGAFSLGMAELSIMPVLSPMAEGLRISIPVAGHIVAAYPAGIVVGVTCIALFGRGWDRRYILLGASCFIFAGNLAATFAQNYWEMLGARFICGLPDGVFFATAAVVASDLAAPGKAARDITLMVLGQSAATMIGVPLATFVALLFGWRSVFLIVAAVALLMVCCIFFMVPHDPAKNMPNLRKQLAYLKDFRPWFLLSALGLGCGGFFAYYAYIDPILEINGGYPRHDIYWLIGLAGTGMVVGNAISAYLAKWVSSIAQSTWAQVVMFFGTAIAIFFSANPLFSVFLMITICGANFFLAGPEQAMLIRDAPGSELLSTSLGQCAFNTGNVVGTSLGSIFIHWLGSPAFAAIPATILNGLGIIALVVFWCTASKSVLYPSKFPAAEEEACQTGVQ